jgi:hypothetical protein
MNEKTGNGINAIKSVNNVKKTNERKGKINGKKTIYVYIYIYTISGV